MGSPGDVRLVLDISVTLDFQLLGLGVDRFTVALLEFPDGSLCVRRIYGDERRLECREGSPKQLAEELGETTIQEIIDAFYETVPACRDNEPWARVYGGGNDIRCHLFCGTGHAVISFWDPGSGLAEAAAAPCAMYVRGE